MQSMAKHRSCNNTAICTGFMDYVRSMRLGLLCISYFLLYLFYATFLVAQTIFRDFFLARNWSLFWALLNHVTGWNHCTHTLSLSDALLFGNYYYRLWVGVLNSKSNGIKLLALTALCAHNFCGLFNFGLNIPCYSVPKFIWTPAA